MVRSPSDWLELAAAACTARRAASPAFARSAATLRHAPGSGSPSACSSMTYASRCALSRMSSASCWCSSKPDELARRRRASLADSAGRDRGCRRHGITGGIRVHLCGLTVLALDRLVHLLAVHGDFDGRVDAQT